MLNIGVLALQGSVREHIFALSKLKGVQAIEVNDHETLNSVEGLIIPGGESTTMGKLLRDFNLFEPLKNKIHEGMPTWGTCAGLILLAKNIVGDSTVHLGLLDASVKRNAYGSQRDSFITEKTIQEVSETPQKLVFIRAPWIQEVSNKVKILATHEDKMIAVKQNNILATSFHPELTDDLSFHSYFYGMCK
jgi:pyridoxal 5'-phosphate synthase pdxT subunit